MAMYGPKADDDFASRTRGIHTMSPTHHTHTPGGLPSAPATTPSMNIAGGNNNNSAMATWNLGAQRKDRKTWTTIRERVDADLTVLKLTSVELEDILKQLLSVTLPNSRIRGEVRTCVKSLVVY